MKQVVNLAFYKEEDWERFLESIDDRDKMHDTWHEWHESYIKVRNGLRAEGFKVRQIIIDIDELCQFCKGKGVKNTGQVRSEFVRRK